MSKKTQQHEVTDSVNRARPETAFDTAFATPFDNPLIPRFPVAMRNTEILTVVYRTDPAAARRLVPEPLEPTGDLVMVHVYHMNDADWFGNYYESAVQIPVHLRDTDVTGVYSPYLYLGSGGAVAVGREVYGQPKKDGQPKLEIRDDLFVGTVSRNGIDVLTATMAYKQQRSDLGALTAYADFRTNINYKRVPHVDGAPAIHQLTARVLQDVEVHECWRGAATMELRPNAQAPVYRLPVRDVLEGFYWRTSFVLPFGEVVHDYLNASSKGAR